MVDCPDLGDDPDLRDRGRARPLRGLGIPVEWKTYTYDEPADLGDRLIARRLQPG
jgi:hypothetical protein